MKIFWAILGLTVAALIGAFFVFNQSDSTVEPTANQPLEITASDHVLGPSAAAATLIEYGDFQCPACGRFYPVVKQLESEFAGRLRFVFRHFPLSAIHPNAFAAARAAEAAGAQGKFFEMHDLLFERQNQWSTSTNAADVFRGYASELGLNLEMYDQTASDGATTDRINSDIRTGQELGIDSTPTFYLNGQKVDPLPANYEDFKAQIEAILSSQPQL